MKRYFILSFFVLLITNNVYAEGLRQEGPRQEIKKIIRENQREARQGVEQYNWQATREAKQELRENLQEKKDLREKFNNKAGKAFQLKTKKTGNITAINGSIITMKAIDGGSYQVNVTSETKLIRRFAGKSELSEFSVGNKISVFGKWANEEKTVIDARLIRNLSLQRRWGAFFGKVTAKTSDSFVMETIERGTQTVYFGTNTRFINRRGEAIAYKDVEISHRVRVKGVWDKTLNKIIDTEEVKNFSLPALPTKGTSPSPTHQ